MQNAVIRGEITAVCIQNAVKEGALMRKRRMARLWGVAVVLTLVMAGCGTGVGSGTGGGGGSGAAGAGKGQVAGATAIGALDVGAANPDTLRDGGIFRWTLDGFPPNFNYNQAEGTYLPAKDVLGAVMPYLFLSGPDGTVSPNSNYLKSAVLTSTTPQVVSYTLQDKATWSDGTPITWRDLAAQWQAMNGYNPSFQAASTTGYRNILSVQRGSTDKQAIVTFSTPFSDWQSLFSPLYPASTNSDVAQFDFGWERSIPVTAGPFKVDAVDPDTKTVTVSRDPKWWGRKPRLDRIVFSAIPTESQFTALTHDQADFANINPDVNSLTRAQAAAGVTIRKALGPTYRHLTFNGSAGSVLTDPRLRIAIQKAIDVKDIAQTQVGRVVPDPRPLGNHIFLDGQQGYVDNSAIAGYDPAAAEQMLDQLGWTRQGTETRRKDGKELLLRDVIPAQTPIADQEAQEIKRSLSQVGVTLVIDPVPPGDFFGRYLARGDFDVTQFSWVGTVFPVSSKSAIYGVGSDDQQNFGGIGNETIDSLFADASAELNPKRKLDLADRIDKEIWKSGHSLLLYQRPDVVAVRSNVANFGAFGFADKIYTDIGFTK
jgi:peptide/nickel transport system substrate-binding protein